MITLLGLKSSTKIKKNIRFASQQLDYITDDYMKPIPFFPLGVKYLRIAVILIAFIIPTKSYGQFYMTGDDPASAKWYSIYSDHFQIIYPEGLDSLARIYGTKLEKYRIPVSASSGFIPGEKINVPMPVVLHPYNAYSNGSVAWAPKRMDLFTLPSAYNPEPMPWTDMLAIHESRHVSQMQFGLTGFFRPFRWIFGEMFNGLTAGLYMNMSFLEGDAVIAETALSRSGRGRSADFLNYYMVAFDNGDFRNWQRWIYGSQKDYTPDHYALGYMTFGGIRYIYDADMFTAEYLDMAIKRPYSFWSENTLSKKYSGKNFRKTFHAVADSLNRIWQAEKEERKSFIPMEQVTKTPYRHTEYTDNIIVGDEMFALKEGLLHTKSLVKISDDGKEKFIRHFGNEVGMLYHSPDDEKIYWSETIPDKRWSLRSYSRIRYMDADGGKKKSLTAKGLIYNPNPSPGGGHIAATEYNTEGGSSLAVLNAETGEIEAVFAAPDSVQLLETAWSHDMIYATGLSDNGYGIYHIHIEDLFHHDTNEERHFHHEKPYHKNHEEHSWYVTLAPQPAMIKNFGMYEDNIMFTSDRTGVNELYHFEPRSGRLFQITSTPYGASEFQYDEDGEYLYYSALGPKGRMIYKTAVDSLLHREVSPEDLHEYCIAEKISAQEKKLYDNSAWNDSTVTFSEPERYRKLPRMFNFHSWAPVYFNVDNIMNMSYDHTYELASLGATAIFQNRLSTAYGQIGYSAHKDPYESGKWRHSGHLNMTYSGLYPVFELSMDFNDRSARQYGINIYKYQDYASASMVSRSLDCPVFETELSVYVPFNFSSGGWFRGLIPRVSYSISNDRFDRGVTIMESNTDMSTVGYGFSFAGRTEGRNMLMQNLSASLRGYSVLGTAESGVYPRWGIGAEIGVTGGLHYMDYLSPAGYMYLYGYLPGIARQQGLMITSSFNRKLNPGTFFGSTAINVLPRGLSSNAQLSSYLGVYNDNLLKITADYAIPFNIGTPYFLGFYFRRMIVTPHFDCTFTNDGTLFSAGGSLEFEMSSLFGISAPYTIGVTASYNGGSAASRIIETTGIGIGKLFIGPVFSVEL